MALADRLKERGFYLRVDFALPCSVTQEVQHKLLRELADQKVDFGSAQFGQTELMLLEEAPNERARKAMTFGSTFLEIKWVFPRASIDVIKKEAEAIFGAARKVLHIQILVRVVSGVQCVAVSYEGDARVFLGETVLGGLTEKLIPYGRPAHCVGIRLFFPAFKGPSRTEKFPIEVKIESLVEDPTELFVEVTRTAQEPEHVTDQTRLGDHLEAAKRFLIDHALGFLEEAKKGGNT